MKKLYFLALTAVSTLFFCCGNKENKCFTTEDSTYLEVESLNFKEIETQVGAGELSPTALDYVNLYRSFLNDKSECNSGKESLKDFICKFVSDAQFQDERMKLSEEEKKSLDNFFLSFKFMLDDDGTLYGWSSLSSTKASYLAGWLDSEWVFCLNFERANPDEPWYLTEFIEID